MLTPSREEKVKFCKKCGKDTKHTRLIGGLSWFMLIVHVLLIMITFGAWFVLLLFFILKERKWQCSVCEIKKKLK